MDSAGLWVDSFWVDEPKLMHYESYVNDAEWEEFRYWLRAEIESLPLCSVARTLREADETFYMTFPGSRRDAIDNWRWQQSFEGRVLSTKHALATAAQSQLHYTYDCNSPVDSPTHLHNMIPQSSYSTLGVTINPSSPTSYGHIAVKAQPTLENLPVAPHIVPSQPRETSDLEHPFLDDGEPYPSPVATSSSQASTPPHSPSSSTDLRRTHSHPRLQFTGDWEADAIAASRSQHFAHVRTPPAKDPPFVPIVKTQIAPLALSDTPVVIPRSTRRHHLTHGRKRVARGDSQPYTPVSRSRSSSAREGEREIRGRHRSPPKVPSAPKSRPASPPVQPKPLGSEGKMACLFCRGRKIACQPPSPEERDGACNQCKRRQQRCNYPKENRRGMRKTASLGP